MSFTIVVKPVSLYSNYSTLLHFHTQAHTLIPVQSLTKCKFNGVYKMQVPTSGVKGFLVDYTVRDLQPRKTRDKICQQCDENNKAVSYCKTCSDYFCDSCLQAHKRLKLFQDHETISTESLTDSDVIAKTRAFCTLHPDEQLQLFCQTCHALACINCFIASHNGHAVQKIKDEVRKQALDAILENGHIMCSRVKDLRKNLESVKRVEREKMEQSTRLKAAINTKADSMITKIETRRAELLQKVEDTYTKDLKELWAEKEHLETVFTSMEGAIHFAKRVFDLKDDNRLLLLSDQVITRLKELNQQKWEKQLSEKIERNELIWSESKAIHVSKRGDRTRYIRDIELIGELSVPSVYDRYWVRLTYQDVPCKVECGHEAEFKVTTAIVPQAQADLVTVVQIEASIRFHSRYYLKPGSIVVEPNDSGNHWTVRFTPNYNGTCYIELRAKTNYNGYSARDPFSPSTSTPDIQVTSSTDKRPILIAD